MTTPTCWSQSTYDSLCEHLDKAHALASIATTSRLEQTTPAIRFRFLWVLEDTLQQVTDLLERLLPATNNIDLFSPLPPPSADARVLLMDVVNTGSALAELCRQDGVGQELYQHWTDSINELMPELARLAVGFTH